ncbi:hemagglutinin repeat-containing protein [Histophilus somni]|uniref:hemagglutinin repeat-containing protein n=1 Tax=Histophilus somni TaxID=731 RepID=UPI0038783244
MPVVQAVQNALAVAKQAEQVGDSKNNRINAMAAANTAWSAYRAGQGLMQASQSLSQMANGDMAQGANVSVSITYGEQKNVQTTDIQGNTAANSAINAGGKVTVTATGEGKESDIHVVGSDVSGQQGTLLQAEDEINLRAAKQTHQERSQNKSAGFNAGVAVSYGSNGLAFGFTAGGNYGKGYGNGDETTYRHSHIGDKGSQTHIMSGGDTAIKGTQVRGKGVQVQAQNLNIESLQDTMTYKGKQMNVSGQVTVGYGFSASANFNQSKINADYASVQEQSGIYAGDAGYQIHVGNHTDLKGGLITSTAQAEEQGKNQFSTGTLSYSDIQNHADYNGSAVGVGVQADINGGWDGRQVRNGSPASRVNQGIGLGYDKDSQSSLTKSGINTQNLIIRDEQGQLAKMGKTVEQIKTEIKTDITTDNAESRSGKLENKFDKEKVLKELNIQVKVTQEFRKNAFSTIDAYVLPKQAELREKIKAAQTEEEKDELYKEIYKLQYQKRLLETTVGIIAGTPEIAITQGTLQLAATKMREETLKNSRLFKGIKDKKTGQILRNDSYSSGYFDGVKLGGVRIDVDVICNSGMGACSKNNDGSITFNGTNDYTLKDAIDPTQNNKAKDLYGPTGGFQSVEGGWYANGKVIIPYKLGDISDHFIESFAGTHDMLGGQIWGWYDKQGNTSQKNSTQQFLADRTTEIAIPIAAPFAVSDLISPDIMELLFKLGGN